MNFRRDRDAHVAGSMDEHLEHDSESQLSVIAEKMKKIKSAAQDIEGEVRSQQTLLESIEAAMLRTRGAVGNVMGKLVKLPEEGITTRTGCYLIAAVVSLFLILYYFFTR